MKKIKLISIILLIFVLFSIIVLCNSPRSNVEVKTIKPTIINLTFNDNQEHKRLIYETFSEVAMQVANAHEYKLHKFDCTDFSKELKSKLKERGFDAYCVFGLLKDADYPLHTWVEVKINDYNFIWIEATNGEIIEDRSNYKLLSKTRNCI